MLVSLALRRQGIEGEARTSRLPDAQGFIDQLGTIGTQPGFLAQLFSHAFRGLEYRMKIVINEKFGTTELQHICMHSPLDKSFPKGTRRRLGLRQCASGCNRPQLAVLA